MTSIVTEQQLNNMLNNGDDDISKPQLTRNNGLIDDEDSTMVSAEPLAKGSFQMTRGMFDQLCQRISFLEAQISITNRNDMVQVEKKIAKKTNTMVKKTPVKSKKTNIVLPFRYSSTDCHGLERCHGLFVQCSRVITDGKYCKKCNNQIITSATNTLKYGTAIERQNPNFKAGGKIKPVHYMKIVEKLGFNLEDAKKEYKDKYGEDMPEIHCVAQDKKKKKKKAATSPIVSEQFDGESKSNDDNGVINNDTIVINQPTTTIAKKQTSKKAVKKTAKKASIKGKPIRFKSKTNSDYKLGIRSKEEKWCRYLEMPDETYQLQKPDMWTDEGKALIIKEFGPIGSKLVKKKKKIKLPKKKAATQESVFSTIKAAAITEEKVSEVTDEIVNTVVEKNILDHANDDANSKSIETTVVDEDSDNKMLDMIDEKNKELDEEELIIEEDDLDDGEISSSGSEVSETPSIVIDMDSINADSILHDDDSSEDEDDGENDDEEFIMIGSDDDLQSEVQMPEDDIIEFEHTALNGEKGYYLHTITNNVWKDGEIYGVFEEDTNEIIQA